jgi:DNA-binding NarL/FixJ family response regulator
VAEAHARGLDAALIRTEEMTDGPLPWGEVVLMMLHAGPFDGEPGDLSVPWERSSSMAEAVVASGAVLILIASGAPCAAVAACLRAGAHAVVDVDDAKRALDVVEELIHGRLRSKDLRSVLPCPFRRDQLERLCELSTMETRVLFYLTCGYTAERIASVQLTSLSTVRAHIRSIFRKLDVNCQIAAVAFANGTASTDLVGTDGLEWHQ